jgi:hypothetical protein
MTLNILIHHTKNMIFKGNRHLWNISKLLSDYMVQQQRRQSSSHSKLSEPQISFMYTSLIILPNNTDNFLSSTDVCCNVFLTAWCTVLLEESDRAPVFQVGCSFQAFWLKFCTYSSLLLCRLKALPISSSFLPLMSKYSPHHCIKLLFSIL